MGPILDKQDEPEDVTKKIRLLQTGMKRALVAIVFAESHPRVALLRNVRNGDDVVIIESLDNRLLPLRCVCVCGTSVGKIPPLSYARRNRAPSRLWEFAGYKLSHKLSQSN